MKPGVLPARGLVVFCWPGRLLLGEEKIVAGIGPRARRLRGWAAGSAPRTTGRDHDIVAQMLSASARQRATTAGVARQDGLDQARQCAEIHQRHESRQGNASRRISESRAADESPLLVGRALRARRCVHTVAIESGIKSASSSTGASHRGPTERSLTMMICKMTIARIAPRASQKSRAFSVRYL